MNAVVRLMLTYFTGTTLLRWVTIAGLVGTIVGSSTLLYLPPLVRRVGLMAPFSLVQAGIAIMPIVGMFCLIFGASLLPAMFAQIAASHSLYVLPHGRSKLLASAFGTVALLAAAAGAIGMVYYRGTSVALDLVFVRTFAVSLLTYTSLYVVMWFAGRSRTAIGLLGGAVLTIVTLVLPVRFIFDPGTPLWLPLGGSALTWSLLAAAVTHGARLKNLVGGARAVFAANTHVAGSKYRRGREVDLLVGTGQPWLLALGQLLPIATLTQLYSVLSGRFVTEPTVWLFYLTISSALAGAITSLAASRSRALWLRASWTRAELFARVEAAFWRHNSRAIGVLLIVLAVGGSYVGLPVRLIGFAAALLVLSSAASTYLGLMMTRGIGLLDCVLATVTMLLLMTTALFAAGSTTQAAAIAALESLLGALVLLFRYLSRRRWTGLDWMQCRPERVARAWI